MVEHKKEYYLLLLLGVITWWLVEFFAVEVTITEQAPPHSPDFFSTGYVKLEMNETGVAENEIFAEHMTHFSDDGTVEMTKPVMTFYNNKTPPWVVKSESGYLSADRNDLFLKGKVHITRAKAAGVIPITVNTTNLQVKPKKNFAETADWAELIAPPSWVTGVGMKVYFQQPIHLEFVSKVRSRHEAF